MTKGKISEVGPSGRGPRAINQSQELRVGCTQFLFYINICAHRCSLGDDQKLTVGKVYCVKLLVMNHRNTQNKNQSDTESRSSSVSHQIHAFQVYVLHIFDFTLVFATFEKQTVTHNNERKFEKKFQLTFLPTYLDAGSNGTNIFCMCHLMLLKFYMIRTSVMKELKKTLEQLPISTGICSSNRRRIYIQSHLIIITYAYWFVEKHR